MGEFDKLVPEALTFLNDLSANNSRDWFTANKARYDAAVKAPALALGDEIAARLETRKGAAPKVKLFRPQRDVRFSKDKTPYHTHLHLLWSQGGGPGWYFGVSATYVTAGLGMMGFSKDELARYRSAIDENMDGIGETIAGLMSGGMRLSEAELKRVPAPFDKEHPRGDLLRAKSLAVWHDFAQAPDDLAGAVMDVFDALDPVFAFCQKIAD